MTKECATYDWRGDIAGMLPERMATAVEAMDTALAGRVIELRMGSERPMLALDCCRDYYIAADGAVAAHPGGALTLTGAECRQFMDAITKYSAYAYVEELRNGFLTLKGGYRVGIAGRAVMGEGGITGFGVCTAFCIRIPREVRGTARGLVPRVRGTSGFQNTLIISPPGIGKTTLLRDLVRELGCDAQGRPGLRVCVVDERSEIAGGIGARRFDLGARADVLDGCPKAQGIVLALRSLNPQVIATDEVGRPEDALALEDALNCGVGIVATAHGGGIADILRRPVLRSMVEGGMFRLYVVMDGGKGIGGITEISEAAAPKAVGLR